MKKKKIFRSLIEIEKEYLPEAFKRRLKKIKEDQEMEDEKEIYVDQIQT